MNTINITFGQQQTTTIMQFNLTNIDTFESRNGYGMYATLLCDGVAVCDIDDRGDGSMPMFRNINQPLFDAVNAAVEALPITYGLEYGFDFKIDLSMFICLLHLALETQPSLTIAA